MGEGGSCAVVCWGCCTSTADRVDSSAKASHGSGGWKSAQGAGALGSWGTPSSWFTEGRLLSCLHVAEVSLKSGRLVPRALPAAPLTGDFEMPKTPAFGEDTNVMSSPLTVWVSLP